MSASRGTAVRGASAPVAIGAAVAALAWALAFSTVVVGVIGGIDWSPVLRLVITAVVYAPVAAVIVARRHRALAVILASLAIGSGALALAIVLRELPAAWAGLDDVVSIVAIIARQPENAAIGIMPWLLVTGARRRRALGIGFGASAIAVDVGLQCAMLLGAPVPVPLVPLPLLIALVSLVLAGPVLVGQWRRGDPGQRRALGWFAAGAVLLIASYVRVVVALPAALATLGDAVFVLAQGLLPTAVLAVVLGGRELGRDRRLVDGIVLVQSLAFGVSLYLVIDLVARALGLPPTVAGAFAAGALALAFSALSGVVRRRTARLYFGADADARAVLRRLGGRIADAPTSERAVLDVAAALREAWGVRSVAIRPAGDRVPSLVGDPGGSTVRAELVAGGRVVGEIELTADRDDMLRRTVLPVLDEIAPLIGVAVLLASVNEEVAATRRRTLGIRREERRMLHRELHDELAPSLAGIGFGMTAAGRLIAAGSAEAVLAVGELRLQVARRADDVRRLARALLPTALDAGDLDGALRELAERFAGDGVRMHVRAAGVDVLDAAAQVSVYLAVAEAVARLRRHPATRRIEVVASVDAEVARVTVESEAALDDAEWGAVVRSVARRVADVGGGATDASAADDAPPGCRRVEAVIPR